MRGAVVPLVLLAGLLAWSGAQIAGDLAHRPGFATRQGFPVELLERDTAPDDDLPACWPPRELLAAELPELLQLGRRFEGPPCGRPLPEVVVLEAWPGGRIVWSSGERLVLERW